MKLIIEGEQKEIAALVSSLQERQSGSVPLQINPVTVAKAAVKAVQTNFDTRESHPMVFDLKKHFFGKPKPQAVEVSFPLAYPDWCKLEDSDVWHRLEEVVGDFQKTQEHLLRQVLR